jgi:hypothetical protein
MREFQSCDDQESVVLYRPHGLGEPVHLIGDNLQILRLHIPGHQRLDLFAGELKVVVLVLCQEKIREKIFDSHLVGLTTCCYCLVVLIIE